MKNVGKSVVVFTFIIQLTHKLCKMKHIIIILFIFTLLSSCERGSISNSGRQPAIKKESTTKVVILQPKNYTYTNGETSKVYKVKILSNSTVGHIASPFTYDKGDTIMTIKSGIRY